MPKIQLILTDDWELRGDGSGDMRVLMFATSRRLTGIYDRFNFKASFNAEIMQQLACLEWGRRGHSELASLAQEWEQTIKDVYSRGHDVQFHVHPQWKDAIYSEGRWQLGADWSLTAQSFENLRRMLTGCKEYLEALLKPINPGYRCAAFRGGAWSLAPSDYMLGLLAELGIVFDMSIAQGLYFNLEMIRLDYRKVDEAFLPYYPAMIDARRMSSNKEPIVCVPTHTFTPHPALRAARIVLAKLGSGIAKRPSGTPIAGAGYAKEYFKRWKGNSAGILNKLFPGPQVSDLSTLSFIEMKAMLADIRRRARDSGWPVVPVILENHTKDIGDFEPIEKFCALISESPDIEVITSAQLAENIKKGMYPILRAHE